MDVLWENNQFFLIRVYLLQKQYFEYQCIIIDFRIIEVEMNCQPLVIHTLLLNYLDDLCWAHLAIYGYPHVFASKAFLDELLDLKRFPQASLSRANDRDGLISALQIRPLDWRVFQIVCLISNLLEIPHPLPTWINHYQGQFVGWSFWFWV